MICDICHLQVSPPFFFTEYYNPKKGEPIITYCCENCQMKICNTIEHMKVRA